MFKKLIAGLLISLMVCTSCGKEIKKEYTYFPANPEQVSLTKEQVNEDFEYLMTSIEENYPFLDVNKRLNNVDFIGNKEKYRLALKDVDSGLELYRELSNILLDLNNLHTHLISYSDGMDRNRYHELYSGSNSNRGEENAWMAILEDERTFDFYGEINNGLESSDISVENKDVAHNKTFDFESSNRALPDGLSTKIYAEAINDNGTGYVRVDSMYMDGFDSDKKYLENFFSENQELKSLIIDIRNNGGGSSEYWKEVIVKPLLKEEMTSKTYSFYKAGGNNVRFLKSRYGKGYEDRIKPISNISPIFLPKARMEIFDEFDIYSENKEVMKPKDSYDFQGNIYLLVGPKVFSAAEGFAIFAKQTGFATLIGEKTMGDGIGIDPAFILLPNSGLIIRYPMENGLLQDGQIAEEIKTEPDYLVYFREGTGDINSDPCVKKAIELEIKD